MTKIKTLPLILILTMLLTFTGCGKQDKIIIDADDPNAETTNTEKDKKPAMQRVITIGILKGPSGIGSAKLMKDNDDEETYNAYDFVVAASPDELVAKITNGEIDVAALPINTAAALYNKSNGTIKMIAVNSLCNLYILNNGNTINSLQDLSGKTIYASGMGAMPEYILKYLLEKNDIKDVNIEFKSTHAELAALMASGEAEVCMLPEPYVTTVTLKNPQVREVIKLTDEWTKINPETELPMGCLVAGSDYIDQNTTILTKFLEEYEISLNYAKNNVPEAAELVAQYKIIDDKATAEKAIPRSNIAYIDRKTMKDMCNTTYEILNGMNPDSIGGKIPDEQFYYQMP